MLEIIATMSQGRMPSSLVHYEITSDKSFFLEAKKNTTLGAENTNLKHSKSLSQQDLHGTLILCPKTSSKRPLVPFTIQALNCPVVYEALDWECHFKP